MATGHPGLKKVGRFWHYSLKVNGQRVHGSTRATDLTTARGVLEERRKELLNGQLKRSTRIVTVRELVNEWLAVHQTTFSKGHLVSAECSLKRWVLPGVGGVPVKRLTTQEASALRIHMLEGGCSPTYANNIFRTLRAICQFGVCNHYLQAVPFDLPKLKVQRKPRATVPAETMKAFLEMAGTVARNPHVRTMLMAMIGLGLREAETLGMRWEWFDLDQRTYTVGKAKGKEARILPVPSWLWNELTTQGQRLSGWVFPAADGQPHRPQFCKKALGRVCQALGLGNVTQHRLRASFATLHAEAGTPIHDIQAMLGHKSVTTTMLYVEQTLEAKRKAQDALSRQLGLA